MSAVNASITSTSLDAERRSHEPSMEEILASIRRIIADDEALPVVRRDREKKEPRETEAAPRPIDHIPVDETRDRAPAVVVPVRLAPPQAVESRPSLPPPAPLHPQDFWLRPAHRPEPDDASAAAVVAVVAEERQWVEDAEADDVYDADESETSDEAFAAPAGAGESDVVAEASEAASQPLVSPDAAASIASHFQALAASMVINEADVIERYAQEMLRPMLKQWLDDNLPLLVERLVRAEIERVARGRR